MIIRVAKTANYVAINNEPLRDERLSWTARGILAYLLSMPDNWQVSSKHLAENGTESRDRVLKALRELQAVGYLCRQRVSNTKGQWSWRTYIYETPTLVLENPNENRMVKNHDSENHDSETDHSIEVPIEEVPINPLPPFDGEDFIHALDDYHASRVELKHKPLGPRGLGQLYKDLAAWGEAGATDALQASVRNGWQGVFAPKVNTSVTTYRRPEIVT